MGLRWYSAVTGNVAASRFQVPRLGVPRVLHVLPSVSSQKHVGRKIGYYKLPIGVNVCVCGGYPAVDWRSVQAVFPPPSSSQLSRGQFQIHHKPNQDKALTENERTNKK